MISFFALTFFCFLFFPSFLTPSFMFFKPASLFHICRLLVGKQQATSNFFFSQTSLLCTCWTDPLTILETPLVLNSKIRRGFIDILASSPSLSLSLPLSLILFFQLIFFVKKDFLLILICLTFSFSIWLLNPPGHDDGTVLSFNHISDSQHLNVLELYFLFCCYCSLSFYTFYL